MRKKLASQPGLEPGTDGLEIRCSIQLSYWDVVGVCEQFYCSNLNNTGGHGGPPLQKPTRKVSGKNRKQTAFKPFGRTRRSAPTKTYSKSKRRKSKADCIQTVRADTEVRPYNNFTATRKIWSGWTDLNRRPPAPKAGALATALHPEGN